MWPWSELGLESTDDVRTIKKAYARLLKQTRPDEHPEAFQRLHQAYKEALASAQPKNQHPAPKFGKPAPSEPILTPEEPSAASKLFQPLNDSGNTPPPNADPFPGQPAGQQPLQVNEPPPDNKPFFDNTDNKTESLENTKLTLETEPPPQTDIDPAKPVPREKIFRFIRGGRSTAAPPPIEDTPVASYRMRALAFALDTIAIAVALAIGQFLLTAITGKAGLPLWILAPATYPLAALLFEGSRWQATPGKKLLGLKVVNRELMPLSKRHSLGRIFTFVVTTALLWKGIWLVNAFLRGRLLHDRLSKSYVVHVSNLP